MKSRLPVVFLAVAGILAGLAACTGEEPPPCPFVRVDSNTASLTVYADGSSQDLTDVAYTVDLVSFEGDCIHDEDEVEVVMDADFVVTSGPAATPGSITFEYFIAIPQYYPEAAGKSVFPIRYTIPKRPGVRTRLTEDNIRVVIPLRPQEPAASYDVYLGLQLTEAQLRDNRERRNTGL